MNAKEIAARRAVDYVEDNMIVGLGTGSTAYWAIQELGHRVQKGLNIKGIATSNQSGDLAKSLGIQLIPFSQINEIDITIDGADEVDYNFNLIKGGGGALLREKIVAAASMLFIVIVDETKLVPTLGAYPLPVEIVKFGHEVTIKKLFSLGCRPELRRTKDEVYITDNGNYIVDCHFGQITNPQILHNEINLIPGVVDNGLFVNMARRVIVGFKDGELKEFS